VVTYSVTSWSVRRPFGLIAADMHVELRLVVDVHCVERPLWGWSWSVRCDLTGTDAGISDVWILWKMPAS